MKSQINNYRVLSLLQTGDYLCCDDLGLTYILAPCGPQPSLQPPTVCQGVIFPIEIAVLHNESSVESYYCLPINPGMSHCSKGVVKRVTIIMRDLAETVSDLWKQGQVKHELADCLTAENCWISRQKVTILWIKRQAKCTESVVQRLGRVFHYLLGLRAWVDSTANIRKLTKDMLENKIQLPDVIIGLRSNSRMHTEKGPRFQLNLSQYQPISINTKQVLIEKRKKRSLERTELSLKKSIERVDRYHWNLKKPIAGRQSVWQTHQTPIKPINANHNSVVLKRLQPSPKHFKGTPFNLIRYSEALRLSQERLSNQYHKGSRYIASNRTNSRSRSRSNRTDKCDISIKLREKALKAYNDDSFEEHHRKKINSIQKVNELKQKQYETQISEEQQGTKKTMEENHHFKGLKREIKNIYKRSFLNVQRNNKKYSQRKPMKSYIRWGMRSHHQTNVSNRKVQQRSRKQYELKRQQEFKSLQVSAKATYRSCHPEQQNNEVVKKNLPETQQSVCNQHQNPVPSIIQPLNLNQSCQPDQNSIIYNYEFDDVNTIRQNQNNTKVQEARQTIVRKQKNLRTRRVSRYRTVGNESKNSDDELEVIQLEKPHKPPQLIPTKIVFNGPDDKKQTKTSQLKRVDIEPSLQKTIEVDLSVQSLKIKQLTPLVVQPAQFEISGIKQQQFIFKHSSQPKVPKPQTVAKRKKGENSNESLKVTDINKDVEKQINAYIDLVNVIGQAGGKSYHSAKKIKNLDWFPSVYFIYKRFYRERQKIKEWIEQGKNLFKRPGRDSISQQSFHKWYSSESKKILLEKIKKDNFLVLEALVKMEQRAMKTLDPGFVKYVPISCEDPYENTIAVEESVRVCRVMLEQQDLNDGMIRHIIALMDASYVIAQLDRKTIRLIDIDKRNRALRKGQEQLDEYLIEQQDKLSDLEKAY